jgi:hypothetical protein
LGKETGTEIVKGTESKKKKRRYFPFTLWEISLKEGMLCCHIDRGYLKASHVSS